MADIFETIKNDARKVWDDLKGDVEVLGEDLKAHDDAENVIYSWTNGDLLSFPYFADNASDKDRMMRSLAVMMMKDDQLVSPCDGTIASVQADHNTIAIALNKEIILAVKVCTSCADFTKDAQILVHPGEQVRQGQVLLRFDKAVQSKTKLLLAAPDTTQAFKELGFAPQMEPGAVQAGAKLISR